MLKLRQISLIFVSKHIFRIFYILIDFSESVIENSVSPGQEIQDY